MRPVAAVVARVAVKLATDGRRRAADLHSDGAHAQATVMQVSNPHALVLRQVSIRQRPRGRERHCRIVAHFARRRRQPSPVAPALARSPVDSDLSTGFGNAGASTDQANELLPLLRQRRRTRVARTTTTSRHTPSNATRCCDVRWNSPCQIQLSSPRWVTHRAISVEFRDVPVDDWSRGVLAHPKVQVCLLLAYEEPTRCGHRSRSRC